MLAVEDALGLAVPEPVRVARAMLIELERLYNHAADLGALAMDVGFSLANSHALRIREELLRINEATTGHRLLRGAIVPGGVHLRALPDADAVASLAADLADISAQALRNSILYDRFAGTGILTQEEALDLGSLGYVARASGVATDARVDHPSSSRSSAHGSEGGRRRSGALHREGARGGALRGLRQRGHGRARGNRPSRDPPAQAPRGFSGPRSGVGIVEGWRGTIVHRVEVDARGAITRASIVDPSWFNWPALPLAMRDTILPDFPVTNKSFNLSYAGNDL